MYGELFPRFLCDGKNFFQLLRIHGYGLFAHHVFSRFERGDTILFMKVVGRGDENDVGLFACPYFGGRSKALEISFCDFRRPLLFYVVGSDYPDFGHPFPYAVGVPLALVAEAYDDHSVFHDFITLFLPFSLQIDKARRAASPIPEYFQCASWYAFRSLSHPETHDPRTAYDREYYSYN